MLTNFLSKKLKLSAKLNKEANNQNNLNCFSLSSSKMGPLSMAGKVALILSCKYFAKFGALILSGSWVKK